MHRTILTLILLTWLSGPVSAGSPRPDHGNTDRDRDIAQASLPDSAESQMHRQPVGPSMSTSRTLRDRDLVSERTESGGCDQWSLTPERHLRGMSVNDGNASFATFAPTLAFYQPAFADHGTPADLRTRGSDDPGFETLAKKDKEQDAEIKRECQMRVTGNDKKTVKKLLKKCEENMKEQKN